VRGTGPWRRRRKRETEAGWNREGEEYRDGGKRRRMRGSEAEACDCERGERQREGERKT